MTTSTSTSTSAQPTVTTEGQDLHQIIEALSDDARERLAHYVEFLRYEDLIEEQEEAEDIAYIEAITQEERDSAVPESVVIADYEAKYGPLD
ncbi:MAG: hypothetical protein LBI74_04750 [Synergistaceae bacterium]|jgi:hypothetical protein|nr:hypothetical protein [Synergistaceae bacterium]